MAPWGAVEQHLGRRDHRVQRNTYDPAQRLSTLVRVWRAAVSLAYDSDDLRR